MEVTFSDGVQTWRYWKERLTMVGLSLVLLLVLLWMRWFPEPGGRHPKGRDVEGR